MGIVPLGIGAGLAGDSWGGLVGIADLAVGVAFIGAGVLVRGRLAVLLVAVGFTWFAGNFATALLFAHRGPLVHLLVAYPAGRLRGRAAHAVVVVGYLDAVVYPLGRNEAATVVLCAAVLLTVASGYLRSSAPQRRAPIVGLAGALTVASVLSVGAAGRLAGVAVDSAVLWTYQLVLLAVVVAIFVDYRLGAWRQAAVTGLVLDLGKLEHGGAQRAKLARALGDPSVQLAYWVPEAGGYVDITGQPLGNPIGDTARVLTVLNRDGMRFGALVHDAAVVEDAALVADIASLAQITLINARLRAEVRNGMIEVKASRRRIVDAADAERQRLGRELHDGVERSLLAVRELLGTRGPECAGLRELLASSLAGLTEFARGVHPRTLTESGLHPALTELVAVATFPVDLDVPFERVPTAVEAAAYFVCSEALANITKHAEATSVRIRIEIGTDTMTVEIVDDGHGGADCELGSGLQGLADRVGALGGTFHLDSPLWMGTRLVCTVPIEV